MQDAGTSLLANLSVTVWQRENCLLSAGRRSRSTCRFYATSGSCRNIDTRTRFAEPIRNIGRGRNIVWFPVSVSLRPLGLARHIFGHAGIPTGVRLSTLCLMCHYLRNSRERREITAAAFQITRKIRFFNRLLSRKFQQSAFTVSPASLFLCISPLLSILLPVSSSTVYREQEHCKISNDAWQFAISTDFEYLDKRKNPIQILSWQRNCYLWNIFKKF